MDYYKFISDLYRLVLNFVKRFSLFQASGNQVVVSAFEYKDEDGDTITVKSNDELQAMLNFHLNTPTDLIDPDLMNYSNHLVIYPKVCKANRRRNLHKLKVAIAPSASSFLLASQKKQESSNDFTSDNDNYEEPPQTNEVHCNADQNSFIGEHDVTNNKCDSYYENTDLTHDSLYFLETLGTGNSGIVRSAVHKRSKTITAVKSIALDLSGEEKKRILLELEILRR